MSNCNDKLVFIKNIDWFIVDACACDVFLARPYSCMQLFTQSSLELVHERPYILKKNGFVEGSQIDTVL